MEASGGGSPIDSDLDYGEDDLSEDLEAEKELEERIRLAKAEDRDKIFEDVSDAQSVMTSMSHTMSHMNFIPLDADLDNIIDQLVTNTNTGHLAELEKQKQERLAQVKDQNALIDAEVYQEEYMKNLDEIKELNQVHLGSLLAEAKQDGSTEVGLEESKGAPEETKADGADTAGEEKKGLTISTTQTKTDYLDQIKQAREKAAAFQFKFAEEEAMKQIEEEAKQPPQPSGEPAVQADTASQPTASTAEQIRVKKAAPDKKKKANRLDQQKLKFEQEQEEIKLEIERLNMANEDAYSLQVETFNHRQKFAQKDEPPPALPKVFTDLGQNGHQSGPFAYRELEKTPRPDFPHADNYQKFQLKLRLPTQVDLSKVKVLWSKEKETAEQEAQRKAEAARRKKEKQDKLSRLVQFSAQTKNSHQAKGLLLFKKPQTQAVAQAVSKVEATCRLQLPADSEAQVRRLRVECPGQAEQAAPMEQFEKRLLQMHAQTVKDCSFTMAAIEKQLPSRAQEFDEYKVSKKEGKPVAAEPSDCAFGQALELSAAEQEVSREVELKNEQLGEVDVTRGLSPYSLLVHLDISMNKISALKGGFEVCPNLRTLVISDNLLREITPFMFAKCKQLRSLNLDINQITKLQNLQTLTNLADFSAQNNKIACIEGLTSLTKLRRLNLSFNRLTKVEGLSTLLMLQFLELGKNYISNADALSGSQNKFIYLSELYLYINQIRTLPRQLSFPQLKTLNLNQNSDLAEIDLAYCPLLESISVNNCSVRSLNSFQGCQSLRELDIAFNQIDTLGHILGALQFNDPVSLKALVFNDNAFNQVRDEQNQVALSSPILTQRDNFNSLLVRVFPCLAKINEQYLNAAASQTQKQEDPRRIRAQAPAAFKQLKFLIRSLQAYRGFNNRQLAQKILITFQSTTALMKMQKSMLPQEILTRLLKTPLQPQRAGETPLVAMDDSRFFENQRDVWKLRNACRAISNYVESKRVRRKVLVNKMRQREPLVVKLQAALRGHICRVKNKAKVDKIRRDGLKGTRKYKAANKIQALFRGFAFRNKRKKALAMLRSKPTTSLEGEDLEIDPLDDDEFDAEAFLDVKAENLEAADIFSGANASLMEKYIQVLAYEQQQSKGRPPLPRQGAPMVQQSPSLRKNGQLPPISPGPGTTSVPRSVAQANSKPKSFHLMQQQAEQQAPSLDSSQIMMAARQPRGSTPGRRNIQKLLNNKGDDQISEIDMNSDARSMQSAQLGYQKLPLKQNNLMGTQTSDFQNRMNASFQGGFNAAQSQMSDSRGMLDDVSMQSGAAPNLFHPRAPRETTSSVGGVEHQQAKLREVARLKREERDKIQEEWGFSNPQSMAIWEARQNKKKAVKKKNIKLNADQKLEQFRRIANKR